MEAWGIRLVLCLSLCLLFIGGVVGGNPLIAQNKNTYVPGKPQFPPKCSPLVPCQWCKGKGYLRCKKHKKRYLKDFLDGVLWYCSEGASCKKCGGNLFVDCKHCTNPDAERDLASRKKKQDEWLKKRRERVDALIQHSVLHGASEHFDFVCDLKPMKVNKVRFSTHDLLHLYLRRMEDFRKKFIKVLQLGPADMGIRTEVLFWRDGRDQSLAARKFCGISASGSGVKMMGTYSIYSFQYQKRFTPKDSDVHRTLVHNLAHLFLSNIKPELWIGHLKGGWVDAGLGHYFEYLLDGTCATFCYEEVASNKSFKSGKWLVPVRKMVALKKAPSFSEVSQKNTDSINVKEHAVCFSWIHYLFEGDLGGKNPGKKFVQMVRILKHKKPTRDALRAVYGVSPLTFERKWKEWVLKTYPSR